MPRRDPKETERTDQDTTEVDEDLSGPGLANPLKNMRNTLGNKKSWNSNISISYTYSATDPSKPKRPFGLTQHLHSM